ncbi:MAG TPA: extracellular solute-binding protein [Hyphomicrobium sp.]|nr:extracellular solute-binding protein [Hyphomicrobium sp.]
MLKQTLYATIAAAALMCSAGFASAKCTIEGSGEVDIIANSFPVLDHIGKAMQGCSSDKLKVNVKLTDKARIETEQAFKAGTSPFEAAHVSNGQFVALYSQGLLQPITDLVKKYKDKYKLEDRMLVTVGDDVYAIAFMANAQHLFYRKDLFEKNGIAPPKTFDDVLAASEKLKKAGMDTPYAGAFKAGWDLATEYTNIYLGMGGEFFEKGSAKGVFNNDKGIKTLELMKKLQAYMSPNALALATGEVTTAFQQGQSAVGMLWGSRAANMNDDKVSKVAGQIVFAAAPSVTPGGKPASAIWWDAFAMPKAMDGNRDLAFQVMMEGLSEETMKSGMEKTVWLRSGYKPSPEAMGIDATLKGGAADWPDEPYFALAHTALGKNAADYLAGRKTAQEALADASKEYDQTAREKGFIK